MGIDGSEIKKYGKKPAKHPIKNNKYPLHWMIIAIIVGLTIGYVLAGLYQPTSINPQRVKKSFKVSFVGGAGKELGNQGMELGFRDLSQRLLTIMNAEPNKPSYRITYTTSEDDRIVFGYDLNKQILLWMLSTDDGPPKYKAWTGHIQYRLIAASNGRSLNDTPDGKSLPAERRY